jgi:hypothetical protein
MDRQGKDAPHLSMDFDEFRLFGVARAISTTAFMLFVAATPSTEICRAVDEAPYASVPRRPDNKSSAVYGAAQIVIVVD